MPPAAHYDAIVIGTSQGGRFLPMALVKSGRKVAVIERDHLGGVCVNRGCTPTKTMVASARVAYLARRGADFGVRTGLVSVDMQAVRQRKQAMVEGARRGYERGIEALQGLDLLLGQAHFIAPKTLEVHLESGATQQITAPLIIIDAGSRPEQLTIKGAESVSVLDSTSIMELVTLPGHLLIIGGGYIALEFGQMFRRFGSQVTLVQHHARLLMNEDEDVSDAIAEIFREDGISTQDRLVLHTIFIGPQLGRVGLTENEARKQGRSFRVAKLPMNQVIRALETGETRGFMKAIIDADT